MSDRSDSCCNTGAQFGEEPLDVNHYQFLPAYQDFAPAASDGFYNFICRLLRTDSAGLSGVVVAMSFTIPVQCIERDVCADTSRTDNCHADSLV